MNATSAVLGCCVATLFTNTLFGQSCFELNNRHTPVVNAPVFDGQGVPLQGANFLVELWGGSTSNSLTPLLLIDQGYVRSIRPFRTDLPGYFPGRGVGGALCVVDVPPDGFAWLQVRAWQASLGLTYEAVSALGLGGYGASPLFFAQGSDPFREPPVTPGSLIGLQSFSLLPVVPEPGTGVLVLLGFGCLAAWRWFNRRAHSP